MTLRRALWLLAAAYVLYGGLIPFKFIFSSSWALTQLERIPLNPFISPETGRRLSIPDVVQNFVFFVPFGLLGAWALARSRDVRHPVIIATAAGLGLSVVVETLQLFTIHRVSSIADVLMNTLGAMAGAMMAAPLAGAAARGMTRLRARGFVASRELYDVVFAGSLLWFVAWQPFDFTLDVSHVAGDVKGVMADAWQFTGWRDEGLMWLVSAFASATFAGYVSSGGRKAAGTLAALSVGGFAAALEAGQVLIESRTPGLWDVSVWIAGAAAGAAFWSVRRRIAWPAFWNAGVIVSTAIAAGLLALSPFAWSEEFRSPGWFSEPAVRPDWALIALGHIIETTLVYVPLGFFLGRSVERDRRSLGLTLAAALLIGALFECFQGWIVGADPAVSDVALGAAGAWLGWNSSRQLATYNGRAQ